MSNRSDTNSYEPARIRPRVQSLRDSAVRPPHGCVLLTNVDGFRFEKVEGGGRDGLRGEGGGGGGGRGAGWGGRQDSPFRIGSLVGASRAGQEGASATAWEM